jgi:hypothetical protein
VGGTGVHGARGRRAVVGPRPGAVGRRHDRCGMPTGVAVWLGPQAALSRVGFTH